MKLAIKVPGWAKKTGKFLVANSAAVSVLLSFAAIILVSYNTYQIKNMKFAPVAGATAAESPEKILKELPKDAPRLGDPKAKLTLVEFGDFQCPYCGRFFNQHFSTIKKEYIDTGKINFVYMDYAFLGQESKDAAEAAKCATEQGRFWEYHDELYKNQKGENLGAFNPTKLKEFASNINLDLGRFESCVESDKYLQVIEDEKALGSKYGVSGTPNFLIGKQLKKGAGSVESLRQMIDAELK